MKEINKQHDQLSGYISLIAIPIINIKSITISAIYCYNPNANFLLECNKESISYSSESEISKAGISIKHSINTFIKGVAPQKEKNLLQLVEDQYTVILKSAEGNYTIIGDSSKGLNLNEFLSLMGQ